MLPEPLQVLKILAVSFMSASSQRFMTVRDGEKAGSHLGFFVSPGAESAMAAIGTHAPGGLAIDQLLKLVASGAIAVQRAVAFTGGGVIGGRWRLGFGSVSGWFRVGARVSEYQCFVPQPLQVLTIY